LSVKRQLVQKLRIPVGFWRRFSDPGSISEFREQGIKQETGQRTEDQFSEPETDGIVNQRFKKHWQRNGKRPGLRLMVSIYGSLFYGLKSAGNKA
jgi:hypothetical protein